MAAKNDKMEVTGDEDAEKEFLQAVTCLDDNLDNSIDSFQGSLTLPTFTMGQSAELTGSQGFMIGCDKNLTLSQSCNESSIQKPMQIGISHSSGSESGFILNQGHMSSDVSQVTPTLGHVTTGVSLQGNTLVFQGSQISALSMIQNANQYQIVIPSVSKDINISQQLAGSVAKNEVSEVNNASEVFEASYSDEKAERSKTSPKHHGRKSRSTSSSGNDMTIKSEATSGLSPCRMDTTDAPQAGGDMGFKPSLLDEILTEKKLALMKSPDVIQFLQAQQQNQTRDKFDEHIRSKNS